MHSVATKNLVLAAVARRLLVECSEGGKEATGLSVVVISILVHYYN